MPSSCVVSNHCACNTCKGGKPLYHLFCRHIFSYAVKDIEEQLVPNITSDYAVYVCTVVMVEMLCFVSHTTYTHPRTHTQLPFQCRTHTRLLAGMGPRNTPYSLLGPFFAGRGPTELCGYTPRRKCCGTSPVSSKGIIYPPILFPDL